MARIFGLIAIGAAMLAPAALAQTAAERAACQDDFKKLCPGVMPGGGRPLACLAKQKEKLSPACLKVVETHAK